MSIFDKILAKILPSSHARNTPGKASAGSATAGGESASFPAQEPQATGARAVPESAGGDGPGTIAGNSPGSQAGAGGGTASGALGSTSIQGSQTVDVEQILSDMQSRHGEQLNWRTSIVDLLKLLGLDSSLSARKELASELGYQGSTQDSASMNLWLHKEVMRKLAENGGKVPEDLKH